MIGLIAGKRSAHRRDPSTAVFIVSDLDGFDGPIGKRARAVLTEGAPNQVTEVRRLDEKAVHIPAFPIIGRDRVVDFRFGHRVFVTGQRQVHSGIGACSHPLARTDLDLVSHGVFPLRLTRPAEVFEHAEDAAEIESLESAPGLAFGACHCLPLLLGDSLRDGP